MGVIRQYSSVSQITALDTACTATATQITTVSYSGYPDPPHVIKIDSEILLVTDITFNLNGTVTLDVTRGYDGSVAAAHDASTEVQHVVIGEDLNGRWQDIIVSRPFGIYDDEFDDESLDPAWVTRTVTGTTTWTESNGVLSAFTDNQSSSDASIVVRNLLSATPLIGVHTAVRMLSQNSQYLMAGPVLTDGTTTTSGIVWLFAYIDGTTLQLSLRHGQVTNVGTTTWTIGLSPAMVSGWLHMRLIWRTLNTFAAQVSPDGVTWTSFDQIDLSKVFSPTYAGVGVSTWGGTNPGIATFEFIRVYS
jgi:hypothetical protein